MTRRGSGRRWRGYWLLTSLSDKTQQFPFMRSARQTIVIPDPATTVCPSRAATAMAGPPHYSRTVLPRFQHSTTAMLVAGPGGSADSLRCRRGGHDLTGGAGRERRLGGGRTSVPGWAGEFTPAVHCDPSLPCEGRVAGGAAAWLRLGNNIGSLAAIFPSSCSADLRGERQYRCCCLHILPGSPQLRLNCHCLTAKNIQWT